MPNPQKIGWYTEQAQRLICLLFVLREMPIGGPRKREVIEYIQRRGYLDIKSEDVEPYMTQLEPRWHTNIAFRRKDAVENELLFNQVRDCWDLTRAGRDLIDRISEACRTKLYDVRKCYLWTKYLKKALDPDYQPSDKDFSRPKKFDWATLLDDFKT
jgi:hypothetical protein